MGSLRERLAREEPNRADYQWDLVVSLSRIADHEPDRGVSALRRAIDIAKGLKARGVLLPTQEPWVGELERRLAEILRESG